MAREVLLGPLPASAGLVLDVAIAEGEMAAGGNTGKLGSTTSGGNTVEGYPMSPDTLPLEAALGYVASEPYFGTNA